MKHLLTILSILIFMPSPIGANTADSLYQVAQSLPDSVRTKDRIRAFKRVLKADRKYAPAYCELAVLYMSYKSPEARQDAERAIQTAIQLAPDSVDYQFTLGELLRQKRFWDASDRIIQRILKNYPDYAPAHELMGEEALEQYLLTDENMRGASLFAKKDFEQAKKHLTISIQLNPKKKESYYKLGLLYLESNQPSGLVSTMKRLLKQVPSDTNGLLYCGLGYRELGIWTQAEKYFTQSVAQMEPAFQAVMHEMKHIVTEKERYAMLPSKDKGEQEISIERERFWRKQDPLYLTKSNERILEHYSRVAYANLRFSKPRRDIKGYETDQGKTYIRFGRPLMRGDRSPLALLPGGSGGTDPEAFFDDRSFIPNLGGQSYSVSSGKETWYYEGYQVTFETYDPRGKWRFGGYFLDEILAMMDQGLDPIPSGSNVFHKQKPRFIDPFKQIKYQPPHLITAFKERDHLRVELAYALPKDRLDIRSDAVDLTDGLFLFDENWDKVQEEVRDITYLPSLGTDSIQAKYLLSYRTVRLKPGDYNLVTEILDRRTKAIGAVREVHQFTSPDTGLAVSDLLPASHIEPLKMFPESRGDLFIRPNPLRTYRPSDPVFLYLEVYNLNRNTFGNTRFDIAYRVSIPKQKEIDPGLFAVLDAQKDTLEVMSIRDPETDEVSHVRVTYRLPKQNQVREILSRMRDTKNRVETTVSAEYEGNRTNDFTYLEINVAQLPEGIYQLTVTITDRQTQQTVEKYMHFRVVN